MGQPSPAPTPARLTGTVARLVRARGFGFIKGPEDRQYFFHSSAVLDGTFNHMEEGEPVSFEEQHAAKGPRAEKVQREEL